MEKMIEHGDKDLNIIELVKDLMEKAEQFVDKNGAEKKEIVMLNIKTLIGFEKYDIFEPIISQTIDFIIAISKKNIKLNLNNIKKKYCYCI